MYLIKKRLGRYIVPNISSSVSVELVFVQLSIEKDYMDKLQVHRG
jgi:hypothetical protein